MEEPTKQEEKNIEEKLKDCEAKCDEYLAGWQRAKADFINYKKDEAARLQEVVRYHTEELMRELIGVVDSFNLAISYMEMRATPTSAALGSEPRPESVGAEKQGPVEKGVYMIKVQLEDILKRWGLQKIEVKTGEQFNPAFHEAVGEQESEKPPGTILEEIEPGYRLYDKIIRPGE